MTPLWAGLIAGFVATAILSVMQVMKQKMNLMPQLDMIGMISGMMGASRMMGWVIHFIVGTVLYGLAYAYVFAGLWLDTHWLSGAALGAVGWLIAMLVMMPMAGNGVFGMKLSGMVPVMALMMHLIFGAILGFVFGWIIT